MKGKESVQHLSIKKVDSKILEQIINLHSKYFIDSTNEYVSYSFKYKTTLIQIYTNNTLYISSEDINLWISWVNKYNPKLATYLSNNFLKNEYIKQQEEIDIVSEQELYNQFDVLIGSDEVGIGDFFGGIVVCAVALNKDELNKFKDLNINDSKKISDQYILECYDTLVQNTTYCIKHYSPVQYNQQIAKYQNMHILKTSLHINAINELKTKIPTSNVGLILDAYCSQTNFNKYAKAANLNSLNFDVLVPKAESYYLCVSIASMIARGFFLKAMLSLSTKLGIDLPLGAWNLKIKSVAHQIIDQKGFAVLEKITKNHFKPFIELKKQNDSNS
ncbi:ribonuclease HIII [Ureaplasma diversum]|uniref:ribonuclease HIII n=1 Tax=Ureaplasma diversum TaxID=42094 RepID=UPI001AD84135|nr:hypothetical protein [Ureaplasma diversum]